MFKYVDSLDEMLARKKGERRNPHYKKKVDRNKQHFLLKENMIKLGPVLQDKDFSPKITNMEN